jgi:predicted transcriptional regulator/RimJ/RimL family protein N-acetyltransferase
MIKSGKRFKANMASEIKNLDISIPVDASEIILTIKPMHAANIYSGKKKFELRKTAPRRAPCKIYLYETDEKRAITGHIIIDRVFTGSPRQIWREISGKGIEEDRYNKYYEGHDSACVYSIKHAVKYKKPLDVDYLKNEFDFIVPQHFTYVDSLRKLDEELNDISLKTIVSTEAQAGIRFGMLNKANHKDFIDLVHENISENYANTGKAYPQKLIDHFLKNKEINSLTSRRRFIFEIFENNTLCGYIVLTQKITGAFKTAPFCLHKEYVNNGIGVKVRELIHTVVEKQGGRKVYCTVPSVNKAAVNYLLSAKYQIEAHLVRHYHNEHDDIVYAFNLSLAGKISHLVPRPSAVPTRSNIQTKLTPEIRDSIQLCIESIFSGHYAKLFFDKLINKIEKKEAFLHAYAEPTNMVSVLEPKSNRTVHIHIYAQSFHGGLLKKLITSAEIAADVHCQAKKIFLTVDIMDFQILPIALELGYRPEGVLKNYYYVGNDVMVLSKFSAV